MSTVIKKYKWKNSLFIKIVILLGESSVLEEMQRSKLLPEVQPSRDNIF